MKTARELQGQARQPEKDRTARGGSMALGKKLTEVRTSFGLTQTDVSTAVEGISRTLLASIEMGHAMPTLKAMVTLSAFYEVSLDELTVCLRPA